MTVRTRPDMTAVAAPARAVLAVSGMTCASCAVRIEKKLNRVNGVSAAVNFATETAAVTYDPAAVGPAALLAVVAAAGYAARLPEPRARARDSVPAPRDEAAGLRQRIMVSAALTVPVVLLAMVPALQFRFWQWLSLTLAAPVVAWGGSCSSSAESSPGCSSASCTPTPPGSPPTSPRISPQPCPRQRATARTPARAARSGSPLRALTTPGRHRRGGDHSRPPGEGYLYWGYDGTGG